MKGSEFHIISIEGTAIDRDPALYERTLNAWGRTGWTLTNVVVQFGKHYWYLTRTKEYEDEQADGKKAVGA